MKCFILTISIISIFLLHTSFFSISWNKQGISTVWNSIYFYFCTLSLLEESASETPKHRVSASRASCLVFSLLFALAKFVIFIDADASLKAASSVIDIYMYIERERECRRRLEACTRSWAGWGEARSRRSQSSRDIKPCVCVQVFAWFSLIISNQIETVPATPAAAAAATDAACRHFIRFFNCVKHFWILHVRNSETPKLVKILLSMSRDERAGRTNRWSAEWERGSEKRQRAR